MQDGVTELTETRRRMIEQLTETVRERYLKRYVTGEAKYFDDVHPRGLADVIVWNDNPDLPRRSVQQVNTGANTI